MYDLIGDVHGHAEALEALLGKLGYRDTGGAYRHPDGRRALFVGDYVDRGPDNVGVLDTVRRMVDAGQAVALMGNHEYNALCYHTRRPDGQGHLRPQTAKNRQQHARTLEDFAADARPGLLDEYLA